MAIRASISAEMFPQVTPVLGQLIDYSWALEGLASSFTELAQAYVPVRTGFLQSTISAASTGVSVDCSAEADYSQYVEYGTVYQAAQPYFEPAVYEAISYNSFDFYAAGAEAIESEWDYISTEAQGELDAAAAEFEAAVNEGEALIAEGEQLYEEGYQLYQEALDIYYDWDWSDDDEAEAMMEEAIAMMEQGMELELEGQMIILEATIMYEVTVLEIEIELALTQSLEQMCMEEILMSIAAMTDSILIDVDNGGVSPVTTGTGTGGGNPMMAMPVGDTGEAAGAGGE